MLQKLSKEVKHEEKVINNSEPDVSNILKVEFIPGDILHKNV